MRHRRRYPPKPRAPSLKTVVQASQSSQAQSTQVIEETQFSTPPGVTKDLEITDDLDMSKIATPQMISVYKEAIDMHRKKFQREIEKLNDQIEDVKSEKKELQTKIYNMIEGNESAKGRRTGV